MPLRPYSREQTWLLPPRLDDLLPDNHAARYVAEFVDSLNADEWQKLGISLTGEWLGAPEYHPRMLLSVWLYGFMTRTRSCRKLEAACRDQISYLWLTGWQYPDHNTLWRFYKEHRNEMKHLFRYTIQVAIKLNLVDLALQAIDGTKIAANANKDRTYNAKELQRLLARTEEAIREIEEQNENDNEPSPSRLPEKLRQAEQLRTDIKAAMEQLAVEKRKRINLTDEDAELMKGQQGTIAGYNVQATVSPLKMPDEAETTGMIITAVDAVKDPDDHAQLVPMLEQAAENTGQQMDITLADAGYHSGSNLADCAAKNQRIIMPESQDHALQNPYHKDNFNYHSESDSYTCPQCQTLRFVFEKNRNGRIIRIYRGYGAICRQCPAFGVCTKCKNGRELQTGPYDALLKQHRHYMATDEAKVIFKRRKQLPEPVFGILKEQMCFRQFLLRGLRNTRAEATLVATAFNIRMLYQAWRIALTKKLALLGNVLQKDQNTSGKFVFGSELERSFLF